jgi:hypothetical protein
MPVSVSNASAMWDHRRGICLGRLIFTTGLSCVYLALLVALIPVINVNDSVCW